MNHPMTKTLAGLAVAAGLTVAGPAAAVQITATLNADFSGATESTRFPTVTFDDFGGSGSVRMTIDFDSAGGQIGSEFLSTFWFNFTGDANLLAFAFNAGLSTGPAAALIQTCNLGAGCASAFRPDGDGFMDIRFNWNTAANDATRFDIGETVTYDITLAGIVAANFNDLSVAGPGDTSNDFHCATAHAQGLTGGASDFLGGSCSVVTPPPPPTTEVPEPGTLVIFGGGLAGLALVRRRRKAT